MGRVHPLIAPLLFLVTPGCSGAQPVDANAPLILERSIELPGVKGRIDHMAVDLTNMRLFVAEVAQGSVDEVDLGAGKVVGRIAGLRGPQGVAWLPLRNELVVASDDGTVRFYGANLEEKARVGLGDDADNVRIDPRNSHVIVGYGKGGLAVIDPVGHTVLSRLSLPGHPEGFQLSGAHAYINVPDDGSIIAADIDRQQVLARWPTGLHRLNFPMALAPGGRSITIAYRFPAALASINTATGGTTSIAAGCGDADDVFEVNGHVLMICGSGQVNVSMPNGKVAQMGTRKGARTGLYVPELGRLLIAAPAGVTSAAVLILKPGIDLLPRNP